MKKQYKNTHLTRWGTWEAVIQVGNRKYRRDGFTTERESAIEADKMLLEHGKEPVNILKKV